MKVKIILFFLIVLVLVIPVEAQPSLEIMKDTEIEISYGGNEKLINYEEINDEKIWNYENISMKTHYLPNDDFEIDLVLKNKPNENIFYINMDLSGYNVYFQPSLEVEITDKGWIVNDTHAYNSKLDMGVERPIEIVNSYALYEKTPQAGSGKIGHIYRPLIIDSEGKETWGLMNYEDGVMSITVDEQFLENAVYPVIIDPVIGKTDKGGSNFFNKDNINTCQFNISENMAIHNITIYLNKAAGTTDVKCGLYTSANGNGSPNEWLAETEELLNWNGDGWITFNFTEIYYWTERTHWVNPLVNETEIVIAWWSSENLRVYYDASSYTNQWQRDAYVYLNPYWESRYTAVAWADRIVSCYLTYTPFPVVCPPSTTSLFPGLSIGISLLIIASIVFLEQRR